MGKIAFINVDDGLAYALVVFNSALKDMPSILPFLP
jgi:hypothetical protein